MSLRHQRHWPSSPCTSNPLGHYCLRFSSLEASLPMILHSPFSTHLVQSSLADHFQLVISNVPLGLGHSAYCPQQLQHRLLVLERPRYIVPLGHEHLHAQIHIRRKKESALRILTDTFQDLGPQLTTQASQTEASHCTDQVHDNHSSGI